MKKKRLLKVADHIEGMERVKANAHDVAWGCSPQKITRFTMSACAKEYSCGTAGCIAGVAVLLFGSREEKRVRGAEQLMLIAEKLLDIEPDVGQDLFVPCGNLWDIHPQEAATAIRLFVEGMSPSEAWDRSMDPDFKERRT